MTESTPIVADFDTEFDAWLDGADLPQRSVVIYSKPHLFAEVQDVLRRQENLEKAIGKDASQGDNELEELAAEHQRLYDEVMASKSTWYVHALSDDQKTLVREGIPTFERLPEDAPDADKAKQLRQIEAAQVEANLRTVAVATIKIELHDKTLELPKIENAKDLERVANKLRGMVKKIGEDAVLKLMLAISEAAQNAEELDVPKSRKRSESARD
jgi:hypothetical protein